MNFSVFFLSATPKKMKRGTAPLGSGRVLFEDAFDGGGVNVVIEGVCVSGMADGKHGFHIHESGDMTQGCASMGGHYDPHGVQHHGGPDDLHRHAGDLGNVVSRNGCLNNTTVYAPGVTVNDILGRGIVLHEREDDHGKGGDEESRRTGSAGARIACGTTEAQ